MRLFRLLPFPLNVDLRRPYTITAENPRGKPKPREVDQARAYRVRRILLRYYCPDGFAGAGDTKLALQADLLRARSRWATLYWIAVAIFALCVAADLLSPGRM
jgi:hypothetical protein